MPNSSPHTQWEQQNRPISSEQTAAEATSGAEISFTGQILQLTIDSAVVKTQN